MIPLREQAILTANALRNIATEWRSYALPDNRKAKILEEHADDLMKAASLEPLPAAAGSHQPCEERLASALNLLGRVDDAISEDPPDETWYRDYFLLTGAHMVLTDECWIPGSEKKTVIQEYGPNCILEEVNAPVCAPACEVCRDSGVVAVVHNAIMTGDTTPCWSCKGERLRPAAGKE